MSLTSPIKFTDEFFMNTKAKTILVVDDDEDILRILNKILQTAGFTVRLAQSPEEGRKLVAEEPPHLIISDLNMEPEDGYTFIKSIREQKPLQNIPIIVLSAVKEFHAVKKVIALGINDYAIKPIQGPLLLSKIKKALLHKEFAIWTPSKGEEPEITIEMDAQVIELGEVGYKLAGPFKLSPGKEIKIKVLEFEEMTINKYIQQTSHQMKSYLSNGNFSNDVTFLSIGESGSSKIRQYIKSNGQR